MRNILFLTLTLSLAMFISCDEADSFDVRQDALVDYVMISMVHGHFILFIEMVQILHHICHLPQD